MGNGYSVAWRTLDAQYWGVPQRRRRIWLVADFGGEGAPEILFKREGLSGHFAKSREAWERVAETAEGSVGGANATSLTTVVYAIGNGQAAGTGLHEKVESLNCMHDAQAVIAIDRAAFNQGKNAQYDIGISEDGVAQTVVAKGPGAVCCAIGLHGDKSGTIDASYWKGCGERNGVEREVIITPAVCAGFQPWNSATAKGVTFNEDLAPTLQRKKEAAVLCEKSIRRFTPTECARLQGMPSWWCADIPHSDSAEYKMWGNGMALPNALYVMEGFVKTEEAKND